MYFKSNSFYEYCIFLQNFKTHRRGFSAASTMLSSLPRYANIFSPTARKGISSCVRVHCAHAHNLIRCSVLPVCHFLAIFIHYVHGCTVRFRFIRSLSRCFTWLARGGKSGSKFCKTLDDRLILKQMSKPEIQSFLDFAPKYFEYITDCYREKVGMRLKVS